MKIYILDNDYLKTRHAELRFADEPLVECVFDEFDHFLDTHKDVDCIVSPANAFGLMDGGYDQAITDYFGDGLQKRVQQYIIDNYYGEQPVGSSFIIDTGKDSIKMIHTPTMRYPSRIKDPKLIYHCTRSTLICAKKNNVKALLLPHFGGGCGKITPSVIMKMMWEAYKQFENVPEKIDWDYALRTKLD